MLVFAHGLEGSPMGHKIQSLRSAGFALLAPDCRHMCLADRITLLEEVTAELAAKRPVLIGSSYGGLVAAVIAARHPERFRGLLLCAPALHLTEPPVTDPTTLSAPPAVPTIVIHGLHDAVVPIAASEGYRDRSTAQLRFLPVDDDHRLKRSHPLIIQSARDLSG